MRRVVISALGWTSFLCIMFGGYLVYSGVGLDMRRIWFGVLIVAIAFIMANSATNLGWDGVAELILVTQLFQRRDAAGNRISPAAQEAIQPIQKSELPRMRPPIKLHRYLLTTSLLFLLFAFALQVIEYARGMPKWGHSMLDTVAYVFMGIAAFCYFLTLLLNVIFYLRGRR